VQINVVEIAIIHLFDIWLMDSILMQKMLGIASGKGLKDSPHTTQIDESFHILMGV